ncbi:transglutaminase-like domain-containing protein [Sanyastnella coralliicola]|uniref:transglutaminase-like domain-containing protein n=1 Tax=Sanyastnella coralliicola TaxID=3069118 RepID=UPI0027B92E1E|nr:transglutaminase-like domain-containing protein [Longitalea sp. SCSIO 12813]
MESNNNNRHTVTRAIWLVACLVIGAGTFAQETDQDRIAKKYPDEPLVCIEESREFHVEIDDGEITIHEKVYEYYQCMNEGASVYADESIGYSGFSKIEDLKAWSEVPTGKPGKFKRIPVKEFSERDEFSPGIFSDDIRTISFRYSGLVEGAKYGMSYTRIHQLDQTTGRFYFISPWPIEKATYKVVIDPEVKLKWKFFNEIEGIDFTETEERGKTIYHWVKNDVESFDIEDDAPTVSSWAPHILVYVESYTVDGQEIPVLRNADDLFTWYNEFLQGVEYDNCVDVASVVDSITNPSQSEEEKVRTIFRWVQDNIKYVAFESGMGGFIPRDPNSVYLKRFGDCKDMASLIHSMCKHADIPTYLTWIGTDEIPYSFEELPTPSSVNHMILAYGDLDNIKWLDATDPNVEFGVPTSFIQGQEAMLKINEDRYEILTVKEMPADYNVVQERTRLTLEDDVLVGKGDINFSGYYRQNVTRIVDSMDGDEDLIEKFVDDYTQKGNNKFDLRSFDIAIPEVHEGDAVISYEFGIPSYLVHSENEVYVNLNLDKPYADFKLEEDRELPREFRYQCSINSTYELEIPEGYELKFVPDAASFAHEDFQFSFEYVLEDNQLTLIQDINVATKLLEKEDFEEWNKMIKAMKKFYRQSIVLEQQ